MTNLITYDYFINDINIPSHDVNSISKITNAITRFQEEVLRSLLGDKLYDAFNLGLSVPSPLTKWINLRDGGVTFDIVVDGETITKTWGGLANSTTKQSLIAYYVYFNYRKSYDVFYTGNSQSKSMSENSEGVDPSVNLTYIYNKFVEMYGKLPVSLFYPYTPVANTFYYDEASAYNFLMANIATYTDWRFTPKPIINPFGI